MFENFLRSIQSYIESVFHVQPQTSAPIIITLFVFIVGFLINWLSKSVSKYLERKSNRKLFIDSLNALIDSVEKQSTSFKETISNLDITNDTVWVYQRAEFYLIPALREMGYRSAFMTYFTGIENITWFKDKKYKGRKRRCFNKTWENVSLLEFWTERIFDDFNRFNKMYNEYLDQWSETIDKKLRGAWVTYLTEKRSRKDLSEHDIKFSNSLSLILKTYSQTDYTFRSKPYNTFNTLVAPIKKLSEDFESMTDSSSLIRYSLEAGNHYHAMENVVNHTKEQMAHYNDVLNKIRDSTQEAVSVLKKNLF